MRPNKELLVIDIAGLIRQGLSYSATFAQICGNKRLSQRTFDKYWLEAQEVIYQENKAKKETAIETVKVSTVEVVTAQILSRSEAQEILTSIAIGGEFVTNSDRINAVKTLAVMEHWDHPISQSKQRYDLTRLTKKELEVWMQLLDKVKL